MRFRARLGAVPGCVFSAAHSRHRIGTCSPSIQNAMDASRAKLSSAYNTVQQRSNEAMETAEHFIQERPWQAVIYAASIGAVIGLVDGMMLGSERDHSWHRRFW